MDARDKEPYKLCNKRGKERKMFAKEKLKIRMRRKAWRPLILGVRKFQYISWKTLKKEGREEW
jgi:hypothetical protein